MTDQPLLPIYEHVDEIVEAVKNNQVVIVEGSTGCGKTTQLPRILLRHGVINTRIGITQPRRIAAISVAWRIAEEIRVELGQEVGYAIRFDDRTCDDTIVKVMTDGILLQEARTDPLFENYDIIMVDEAHERSLNIDFTLGLLHRAVKESNLRVIISSATLNPKTFQDFFSDVVSNVPLISIDARPHPVDLLYRPPEYDDRHGICEAAAKEVMKIHRRGEPGHVLVFMPGEAMIHETMERIADMRPGANMVLLPLFGRLTREEQEEVFIDVGDRRKVVVSTNIAETSITIDKVRYVIDAGWAKVPRIQRQTGITALREEGISQASAAQRAGRAGRTAPGKAIRLYYEQTLKTRPEFTDEEILRVDLTDVVLRLIALGIQDVENFSFPTRPPNKAIKNAIRNLIEMNAIDHDRILTHIGRRMVPFPLSPSLARMIVEAAENYPDAVDEVLIVGAFLSARSPFLFPSGEENEAREAHIQLWDPMGDSVTAVQTYRRYLKSNHKERFCKKFYLDPHIMGFITKAHQQLADIAHFLGIKVQSGGSNADIIRSVATGFARNIMMARGRIFEGPAQMKVAIHPSSACFGDKNRFVVAAEIMVSHRAYARHVSPLEPDWISSINPEAARRFNIRKRNAKKQKFETSDIPQSIRLGGESLEVQIRKGKPTVQVPVGVSQALIKTDPRDLKPEYLRFQSQLLHAGKPLGSSMPIGELLGLLPDMPLPVVGEKLRRDVPQGALLDVERNLHALERYLPDLLRCMKPARGKRPGWLMLVANGGGSFWYEVCPQFPEALEASVLSLEDLMGRLSDDDDLFDRVQTLCLQWGEVLDNVKNIRATQKKKRRR
jgi:ATP-dependent helicase HrpA